MKKFNYIYAFYLLTVFFVTSSLFSSVCQANSALEDHLEKDAFVRTWEPMELPEYPHGNIDLVPGERLEFSISRGSGIRIVTALEAPDITLYRKQIMESDENSFVLVPVYNQFETVENSKVLYYPGSIFEDIIMMIETTDGAVNLTLDTHQSVHRRFYWEKMQNTALKLLKNGELDREIDRLIDRYDTWSFTGLWLGLIKSACDMSQLADDSDQYLHQAVIDISTAFSLLSRENAWESPVEWDSEQQIFTDKDSSDFPVERVYSSDVSGKPISIDGPAWLNCRFRSELSTIPGKTIFELPLDIRIDGIRTGHWPHGICRFFKDGDTPDHDISKPVFTKIFIPRGTHNLEFDSSMPVYVSAEKVTPIYPVLNSNTTLFPIQFFNLIPVHLRNNVNWLQTQFLTSGENPLLRLFAIHYSSRFYWDPISGSQSGKLHLDKDFPGNLTLLSDQSDETISVTEHPDSPENIRLVTFYDPDRTFSDSAPELMLDDQTILIPALEKPFSAPDSFTLALFPGDYHLTIKTYGRRILTDAIVHNKTPEPLTPREYFETGSFVLNGGTHGSTCRIYLDSITEAPCLLLLDNNEWYTLIPGTGSPDIQFFSGYVELMVPSGNHILSFESFDKTAALAVFQPRSVDGGVELQFTRDPFLETINQILVNPPDWTTLKSLILSTDDLSPDRYLYMGLAGDYVRARDLFQENCYQESILSHRMLLGWLLTKTGYEAKALDTSWIFVEHSDLPVNTVFMKSLLEAALDLGSAYRVFMIADNMMNRGMSDPAVVHLLEQLHSPEASYNQVSLDDLAHSSQPRFTTIPDNAISTSSSIVILDNDQEYYLLNCATNENTLGFDITKPSMVRCRFYPITDRPEEPSQHQLQVMFESASFKTQCPISMNWDHPTSMVFPVLEPGPCQITLLDGCAATQVDIQIPSLRDSLVESEDNYPVSIEDYSALLASSSRKNESDNLLIQTIRMSEIDPSFYALDLLYSNLAINAQWKLLGGWPEHFEGKRYLTHSELSHDPIIELRGLDIEDPVPGQPSWLLTPYRRLTLNTELSGHGIIQFAAQSYENADFNIVIEMDRQVIGTLSRENPFLDLSWYPGKSKKIRVLTEDIEGVHPVKFSAGHISNNSFNPLSLLGNHRYHILDQNQQSGGRVIGPACVRMELRTLLTDEIQQFTVSAYTADGDHVWNKEINISPDADPVRRTQPDRLPVSLPVETIIPLPERKIYHLTIKRQSGTSPVFVRPYALSKHSRITPIPVEDCGSLDITDTAVQETVQTESKTSEERDTSEISFKPWIAGVVDTVPTKVEKGYGAWSLSLKYRERDRGEDSQDVIDVYAGDGFTAACSWNKRIDWFHSQHRLYLDLSPGVTIPTEEPDDLISHFTGTATVHWGDSGYRTRFFIQTGTQEFMKEREWRTRIQADIRRTFKLSPRWSWMIGLGGFLTDMTVDSDDFDEFTDTPHPMIYTDFDQRHDSGGYILSQLMFRPGPRWMLYVIGRTLSADSEEDGIAGPWWLQAGFRTINGPLQLEMNFEERQSFNSSDDPDRSRAEAQIKFRVWQNRCAMWELSLRDRYTFEEDWNDVELNLSITLNTGKLLEDFDPFRFLYKNRVEDLLQ